jgi:hypothetical protein
MPLGYDLNEAKHQIDLLRANDHFPGETPGTPCSRMNVPGQRWICGSSNPGGALFRARDEFFRVPFLPDSRKVVLLISFGEINATDRPFNGIGDPLTDQYGFCPPKNPADPLTRDDPPPCRDQQFSVHHPGPTPTAVPHDPLYDAEDYAVDATNFMVNQQFYGGQRIAMYALGVGKRVVCLTGATYSPGPPVVCANWEPAFEDLDSHLPNTGELFLRYVAAIGDDGNPATDPCAGLPSGSTCGNFYFAPDATAVLSDILDITARILPPQP